MTFERRGAELPERHIGEVEWRLQIDEREAALDARDSVQNKLNIAHVHADERKSCPQLHVGRSPSKASNEDAFKRRQRGQCHHHTWETA